MNPHDVFRPNPDCPARGRAGGEWLKEQREGIAIGRV